MLDLIGLWCHFQNFGFWGIKTPYSLGIVLISGFLFFLIRPNFWGGRTCGDLSWLLAEMKASRSRLLVSTWLTRVLSPRFVIKLVSPSESPFVFSPLSLFDMDIKIKIVSTVTYSLYTGIDLYRSHITSALNFATPLFIWFPIHLHWEQCGYSDDTNSTIAI